MGRVTYVELLNATLHRRVALHAALGVLRDRGASPAEAAEAVGTVTGCSADDAALLVRECGAWSRPRGGGVRGRARKDPVGHHGRSGHGAAAVLPFLVLPYVVRPGQGGNRPHH
jgi:hypothetical protein